MKVRSLCLSLVAALSIACGPHPVPPIQPPTPPTPTVRTIAVVVADTTNRAIVGAAVTLDDTVPPGPHSGTTNGDAYVAFDGVNRTLGPAAVHVRATGCTPYDMPVTLSTGAAADNQTIRIGTLPSVSRALGNAPDILLPPINCVPPLPPVPTRDAILSASESFQGLTVVTAQYGTLAWWEVPITSLNAADRQAVYAAKHAAGDRLISISVSWNYCGVNYGFCYPVPGRDLSKDLPALRALVLEAIQNGFYVALHMAGDGMSAPKNPDGSYPYNDPVGWTYGYEWLMESTPSIVASMQQSPDLTGYMIFLPGFDGVVPGWPEPSYTYPGKLDQWLLLARRSLGAGGYVGVELSAGYAHWGGEGRNYTSLAGQALDIVFQEFGIGNPGQPGDNPDQVWQIAARELGPLYNRPPEQPAWDDPPPTACYLCVGTPRGPFYVNAFEYDTYLWVRARITAAQVQVDRAYMRARGYKIVG